MRNYFFKLIKTILNDLSKSRFTVLNFKYFFSFFFSFHFLKQRKKNFEMFLFKIQIFSISQSLKPNSLALALYLYFNLNPLQAKLFTEQTFFSQ